MQSQNENGALTERLGSGLQNRPQQFESAGHLFSEATQKRYGALTERLGSGLQNRPQQFESAGHLFKSYEISHNFFLYYFDFTPLPFFREIT